MFGGFCPMACSFLCYFLIWIKVRKSHRNTLKNEALEKLQRKRELSLTKSCFIANGTFAILILPSALLIALDPMPPNFKFANWHMFSYILAWSGAVIKPFIYVFSWRDLKKAPKLLSLELSPTTKGTTTTL